MKTKEEVLRILQQEKPDLVRLYGVKRLALFGSHARELQREESDVDILVEVDPSIGLGLLSSPSVLNERLESAPRSCRAGQLNRAIGKRSKRIWSMSRRRPPLLVEDIWEAVEKIERYVWGMDHYAFVGDEKTIDSIVRISKSSERPRTAYRKISGRSTQRSSGLKSLVSDIGSFTIILISTSRLYGRLSKPICRFSNPGFASPQTLTREFKVSPQR